MSKPKPNQVSENQARAWVGSFLRQTELLQVNFSPMFLERESWIALTVTEKQTRIRIYFGIETKPSGKPVHCAFAVSTIPDNFGIYRDQPDRIFRLDPRNRDYSGNPDMVKIPIRAWNDWRKSLPNETGAGIELFPAAFLLHSEDLQDLFTLSGRSRIRLNFGLDTSINLLMEGDNPSDKMNQKQEIFDFSNPCPPYCDPDSPFVIP